MKLRTVLWVALGLAFGHVRAQEAITDLNSLTVASEPLPSGPLLGQAPADSEWTITHSLASAGATAGTASPSPATTISVMKSGDLYKVESVDAQGQKMVRWNDTHLQATYLSGIKDPLITYIPSSPYFIDFSGSSFPDVSWISAKNYIGTTKIGSVTALVFKDTVATAGARMPFLTPQHAHENAIALVDLETRRPLMLQVGHEILTYAFSASSPSLSLPKEAQDAFASLRQQIHRASLVPPG